MEEVPFARLKRKRGAPLKYGPDKDSSRKETARQRDATKVYLLSANEEWRSAKQAYEKKLAKPITNGEFALHLLSVHRKSKCPTCASSEKADGGGQPLTDSDETLAKEDAAHQLMSAASTPRKNQQHGARRRKQSSPQGLHRDLPSDSETTFLAAGEGGVPGDSPQEGEHPVISTTTKLLQGLSNQEEKEEMEIFVGVREEGDYLEGEDAEGFQDDVDDVDYIVHPDEEDDINEDIVKESSPVRYKDDEEDEEWKSSDVSDDPDDEDYGTRKSKRKPKPKKKVSPVVAKVPPKMVRKTSLKPDSKESRPRITLKLTTRAASKTAAKGGTRGASRGAPRGRRKSATTERPQAVDKPKPRGPSAFLRRVTWADLDKTFQCKVCNVENDDPMEACRHLLAAHPEMVVALRDFLLSNRATKSNEERTLYSIALEKPLPPITNQHAGHMQEDSGPSNPADLAEKGQMDPRVQHFTDMLMPGYMGSTPPTLPHLASMPSFQQSFNRPPIFDGTQNGMVPMPPHNIPSMASAAAAIFGMGVGMPEGSMMPPIPYMPGGNQEGMATTTPSPTSTHSSMVGVGPQSGPPEGQSVAHNGSYYAPHHPNMNTHQSENIQQPNCVRQTTSQPQSPSQAPSRIPPQSPRPSSQPPCLPTQMNHHNDHHSGFPQRPVSSYTEPPVHGHHPHAGPPPTHGDGSHAGPGPLHGDHQPNTGPSPMVGDQLPHTGPPMMHRDQHTTANPEQEGEQPQTDLSQSPTEIPQAAEGKGQNENTKESEKDAAVETVVKLEVVEEENVNEKSDDKSDENPFEREELLTLIERWVKIPLSCPYCKMKLPYMKRKDRHRCRRPSPSVLCDICGKSYPQTYFRFHYKRVHLPQNNVECQYCHREFRPSSISKHILERHKPFKPYECGICGKEFNSKKHCDKHEAVHKTEKPHKCPTCNRGFTQRTNMKNHMRQHTGEQPYRCHNCMKSFTHNVSLKNHLKRYHGIDLWQLGHTGGGRPKKE